MEEIKVKCGEYIRTKLGYIAKTIHFDEDNNLHCDDIVTTMCGEKFRWLNKLEQKEQITKHSFNLINLIEVGDYVNGYKVEKIENGYIYVDYCFDCSLYTMITDKAENIKSIVTHESFNSIKYEVK